MIFRYCCRYLAYGIKPLNLNKMDNKQKAINYLKSVGSKDKAIKQLTKLKEDLQSIHGMDKKRIDANNKQMDNLIYHIEIESETLKFDCLHNQFCDKQSKDGKMFCEYEKGCSMKVES